MKICLISPISMLDMYGSITDMQLVLAQVKSPVYCEFYRRRQVAGDFIILDNGTYENSPVSVDRMIQQIEFYNPNVVVLPDTAGNSSATYVDSVQYLTRLKHLYRDLEFMYVIQPEDAEQFDVILNYQLREMYDNGVKWVGIPRDVVKTLGDSVFTRPMLAYLIHRRFPDINIHCLGQYGKDPLLETKLLSQLGFVRSLDTSGPIWRGYNGVRYGERWGDIPLNLYIEQLTNPLYLDAVSFNIAELLQAAERDGI